MKKELEIFDKKLIVLYILNHAYKPLNLDEIVKLCEEFEGITYFDICTYVDSLKESNFIAEELDNGIMTYYTTDLGNNTLKELLEFIPGVDLHMLKKIFDKNILKVKKDYSVNTIISPIRNDEYNVSCIIKEGTDELINITVYAGSKEQAKTISNIWNKKSDEIYNSLLEMLTNE